MPGVFGHSILGSGIIIWLPFFLGKPGSGPVGPVRVPENPAVGSAWQDPANTSHPFSGPLSRVKGTLGLVSSSSRKSDPPSPCQSSYPIDFFACSFPGRVCRALWDACQQYQLKAKDNHKQMSTLKAMMPSFPSSAKRPIGDFALTVSVTVTLCYSASRHSTDGRNHRCHPLSPLRGNHSSSPL